jgi:hypothetical protein
MVATYPDKKDLFLFPVPEFCLFMGYTLILLIDKVLFDAHGILGNAQTDKTTATAASGEDPADVKFLNDVKELVN